MTPLQLTLTGAAILTTSAPTALWASRVEHTPGWRNTTASLLLTIGAFVFTAGVAWTATRMVTG